MKLSILAVLVLLGCSSTNTNDGLYGQGTDAGPDSAGQGGGDAPGGSAGAGATGGAAGSGGQAGSPGGGGAAGVGAGGSGGQAGAPSGGTGGQAGGPSGGGTGGTTVDPCATCKIYPNGWNGCQGSAGDPAYWEQCAAACTPKVTGKSCVLEDTFPSCNVFGGPCSYWCCK